MVPMTENDLLQIETKLKITLPKEYRAFVTSRGAELRETGYFNDDLSFVFIGSEQVIRFNMVERPKNSGTGCAFPKWWRTFFMFGTNGGGDFYCLRLDDKPGVWMIGSDCGDEPTLAADSLSAFIDQIVT